MIFYQIMSQFEDNVIYPRVVGNSVGLPAIWVLVAVTIGGNIAGIVGMIFSIPFCSVLYQLFSEIVNKQIKKKKFLNLYILSAHDKKCIDYVGRKAMEVKCLQWDHRTGTEIRKNRNLKIQRRLQKDCFRIWNRKSIKLRRHLCVFW